MHLIVGDSITCVTIGAHPIVIQFFFFFPLLDTVKEKMRKQDSDWEKYLISCYTQSKKLLWALVVFVSQPACLFAPDKITWERKI